MRTTMPVATVAMTIVLAGITRADAPPEGFTAIFNGTNLAGWRGRPHFDPLIVHIPDVDSVERYAVSFPAEARLLAERFWPGPLTLVLPKRDIIPDLVSAGAVGAGEGRRPPLETC